jgi:thiol-disulfide isomerase/thioredoxin
VVVVAVAVTIAVWPRGGAAAGAAAGTALVAAQPVANLSADRAMAALAACPASAAHSSSALTGIEVTCLADGRQVDLGALLAGRPTLVNVWASWCQPCQQELPVLNTYAGQPGAVRVIGVQVQSPAKDGLDLLASLGVHIPTVFDTTGAFDAGGAAARALRLPAVLPVSYLVRPDGTATVVRQPAAVLLSVEAVRQAVATYLGGTG